MEQPILMNDIVVVNICTDMYRVSNITESRSPDNYGKVRAYHLQRVTSKLEDDKRCKVRIVFAMDLIDCVSNGAIKKLIVSTEWNTDSNYKGV